MAVTVSTRGKMTKINCPWISDGAGDATVSVGDYSGFQLVTFQSIPGTGGDQPTNNYSITLIDDITGLDIMCGECEGNRSNASADVENISSVPILAITSSVTVTISGAGDTKTGIVNLIVVQI